MNIRPYKSCDLEQVIQLWQDCGLTVPWNDPKKDIDRKMKINPELFLVAENNGEILGTIMGGYEGHRGWINYLAVKASHRNMNIGQKLVQENEQNLLELGCPKVNLQVRSTNKEIIEYYQKLGYQEDNAVGMGKRLIQDN